MSQSLPWKVVDGHDREKAGPLPSHVRSASYVAPSWSWLSANTKVKAHKSNEAGLEGDHQYETGILAFSLISESPENELGALKAGSSLVIRGRLKPAKGCTGQ